jgi:hypothetical protein
MKQNITKPNRMRLFACLSILLVLSSAKANNISVTNVTLTGQNTSAGVNNANNFTYIEFDLSWENSWRTTSSPNNWDAAWVFVKYKVVGGSTWNHVYLAPSGHNSSGTGTSYTIQVGLTDESLGHNASTNPAVGAFIYRSANGTGTFSAADIRLKWFYRNNNVGDNDIIDVDVYAVEMVYVPDGSFWVGNNGSSTNTTYALMNDGTGSSFNITSEGSFTACQVGSGGSSAMRITEYNGVNGSQFGFPIAYPKGFNGFYCMKYEGSQQNWVDFLNTLTSSQQTNLNRTGGERNGITPTSGVGVFSTTLPFVPKQNNTWPDLAAFLDWAGLRPMTELEFEKACRGASTTNNVVTDEFAWGSTSRTTHGGSLTNAGTASEVSTTAGANSVLAHNGASNPLAQIRCGAFATSSTSRVDAGASFYGIMDMTGNGFETAVALLANGVSGASGFNGIHGNGLLTTSGYADVSNWPGLSSGAVTVTDYSTIRRGGSWFIDNMVPTPHINFGRIANRYIDASYNNNNTGAWNTSWNYMRGIRGVHTKPNNPSETK